MNHADDYFVTEYLDDELDMKKALDRSYECLSMLTKFGQEGSWPYEIASGSSAPGLGGLSLSTSTMIMYSIAVAAGRIHNSVLVPSGLRLPKDKTLKSRVKNLQEAAKKIGSSLVNLYPNNKRWIEEHTGSKVSYSETYGADDPFTLLWLFELLRVVKSENEVLKQWYDQVKCTAIDRIRNNVYTANLNNVDPTSLFLYPAEKEDSVAHVFPLLRFIQLYRALLEDEVADIDPPSSILVYLQNRLHQHLSYFSIRESSYDAAELTFAMEAALQIDKNSLDSATINRCIDVLAKSQDPNPYWRPLRPFVANKKGMVLLPLSVEIAGSLLRTSALLSTFGRSIDPNIVSMLQKYTEWLHARVIKGRAKEEEFVGWHSEYADDPKKIHTWETSQVALYLLPYEALIRQRRAEQSLRAMHLSVSGPEEPEVEKGLWADLFEPLQILGPDSPYAVYHRILSTFVSPRLDGSLPDDLAYSMVLYGPQGTGKTKLAKDVADFLRFRRINLSPSDFIVGGGELVEARAKSIFLALAAQTDVVIVFDEIDRLILDRNSEAYGSQDETFQFMTPGMLTKLHDLRDATNAVFVICTNYAERIDPAIKRPGRFDGQYLVLPPDKIQRANILRREITKRLGDGAHALRISDEELGEVSKICLLAGPQEIKNIVLEAFKSIGRSDPTAGVLMDALKKAASRLPRAIELNTYRARLRGGRGFEPPFEEYLMLAYLVCDVDGQIESLEKASNIKKSMARRGKDIQTVIRDDAILDKLNVGYLNKPVQSEE